MTGLLWKISALKKPNLAEILDFERIGGKTYNLPAASPSSSLSLSSSSSSSSAFFSTSSSGSSLTALAFPFPLTDFSSTFALGFGAKKELAAGILGAEEDAEAEGDLTGILAGDLIGEEAVDFAFTGEGVGAFLIYKVALV